MTWARKKEGDGEILLSPLIVQMWLALTRTHRDSLLPLTAGFRLFGLKDALIPIVV